MKRFVLLVPACALALAFGCGPMKVPLPERLDPEAQKAIDDGWNRALTPPDKLGRQELLDVLVGVQAYQLGVDSFTFRAEKRFAGGKVVMEVGYDRSRPNDDRFEVTVYDDAGKVVRNERYTREEIDETFHALFVIPRDDHGPAEAAPALRADHHRRWEKIVSLFPKSHEPKKQ
jgi:hypothetical protein